MLLLSFLVEVALYFRGTLCSNKGVGIVTNTIGGSIAGRNKLINEESLVPFILPNNRMSIGSKLIYLLGSFMQHGQWKLQSYA